MSITMLKNSLISSFAFGFICGCVPNKIIVQYNNKSYNNIPIPLLSGCIGTLSYISAPLILTNYFFNGTFIDRFIDKYNIDIERYHQCDGKNNKYAFPSLLVININKVSS